MRRIAHGLWRKRQAASEPCGKISGKVMVSIFFPVSGVIKGFLAAGFLLNHPLRYPILNYLCIIIKLVYAYPFSHLSLQ